MVVSIHSLDGITPFDASTPTGAHRSSLHISRKTSWGTPIPPPSSQICPTNEHEDNIFDNVDLESKGGASADSENGENWNSLDNIAALGLSFNTDAHPGDIIKWERFSLDEPEQPGELSSHLEDRPFNKWMKGLHRRAVQKRQTVSCDLEGSVLEKEFFESPATKRRSSHKQSSSGSSFGFVTAVKSASISLASFSVAPRSRRTGISSRQQRTDRNSKVSNAGRLSEDNSYIARGVVIDQAVENRLLQRRRVLEELINTEEGYIADVKFLINIYVTLLASIPTLSLNLRASINRNLNEIVELHEELLGELHRVVPHSEYTQVTGATGLSPTPKGHHRWRSLDAVPERTVNVSWLHKIPGMTAEPEVAANVAKVFAKKMNRFFVYEEYGAKYELMIKDVASTYRTIPQWETYQKGFEALACSLASINSQHENAKKALTVGDLLVKPIQRVCKYPLLFAELLKQTPVCDCPDSHLEIENVLIRIREATTEINRATDDPRMKITMEKSWILQDRLIIPDMPEAQSKNTIRALGHIHLCGVLYVCWQTRDAVDGQYLICLLYRDFFLLASPSKSDQTYSVQACIGLNELRIEDADNGRGLQCHTAPFSWKLVFECDHRLFELTMSACSAKEGLEWRSRLVDQSSREILDAGDQNLFTSVSLPIKPLGTVFGKPGTIARRISIHRATTVGPTSALCQVIVKNTTAFKEPTSSTSINRSQSLLMTNRIPVLAPTRAERVRLESLLADIWTRDVLPFPGMTGRARSEHLVRASASSVMRKLSVASITSNFTKRSSSMVSLHRTAKDDEYIDIDTPIDAGLYSKETKYRMEPDASKSRLFIIQDEKENLQKSESMESAHPLPFRNTASPADSWKRLVSLNGQRIITPPLRTSSANSIATHRLAPLPSVIDATSEVKKSTGNSSPIQSVKSKEVTQKRGKKSKGIGMNRTGVTEGLRSLFR